MTIKQAIEALELARSALVNVAGYPEERGVIPRIDTELTALREISNPATEEELVRICGDFNRNGVPTAWSSTPAFRSGFRAAERRFFGD